MDWMCEQEQEQCVLVDLLLWQEDDFEKETDRVIQGNNGWMNVIMCRSAVTRGWFRERNI